MYETESVINSLGRVTLTEMFTNRLQL